METKINESKEIPNPYKGKDGLWYWYTKEDWIMGPYPTEESAEKGLELYEKYTITTCF
jgi:hypothetical protein